MYSIRKQTRKEAADERKFRTWRRKVVAAVAALPDAGARYPETPESIATYAPLVIDIFKGADHWWFRSIDDQIGNAHPDFRERGYLVRRVRNDPEWGRKLFAVLK